MKNSTKIAAMALCAIMTTSAMTLPSSASSMPELPPSLTDIQRSSFWDCVQTYLRLTCGLPDWNFPTKPEMPDQPENPDIPETPDIPEELPDDDQDSAPSELEAQVLELVNQEREKAGLEPVSLNPQAQEAARIRAKEIVTSFSHTRPDGSSCFTALEDAGVSYRNAGENIAYGQGTPQEVMKGWMNSSGHRANILGDFSQLGIGIYENNGTLYWVQLFVTPNNK